MISTAPFEQPLVVESLRELLPFDEELEGVLALAARDEFHGAAQAAARLWAAGFYDVRVLGCYLYGVYLERSLQSIAVIADCLILLLDSSWSFLSPRETRARDLAVALRWLFAQILRDVQYHERARSERWRSWQDSALIVAFAAGAQSCGRLLAALARRQVPESCRAALVYLQSMAGQLGRAPAESSGWTLPPPQTGLELVRPAGPPVPDWSASPVDSEAERRAVEVVDSSSGDDADDSGRSRPELAEEPKSSSQSDAGSDETERTDASQKEEPDEDEEERAADRDDPGDGEKSGDGEEEEPAQGAGTGPTTESASAMAAGAPAPLPAAPAGAPAAAPAVGAPATPGAEETLLIKVSPALRLLLRRITAFQRLVERQRYRAAAIVLQDLLQSFRAFDPRIFLPGLIAPLFSALRPHEKALEPLLTEPQPGPADNALHSLYLCDLDLFLREAEQEP